MNKKVHVKPYRRNNPKSQGSHKVRGHTRNLDVYVGGRENPRMSKGGASAITDMYNCFHTSLDRKTPYYFTDDEDFIYKMELDLSELPKEKVLMPDDWTEDMVDSFSSFGRIDLKDLEKTRPDMVEYLKEEGYNNYVTTNMLSDEQPLDVFSYPPDDMTPERGTLIEQEVAIFDKGFLEDQWEEKEKVSKDEVFEEDIRSDV